MLPQSSLLFVPLLDSDRESPKEGHNRLEAHDNHPGEIREQVHIPSIMSYYPISTHDPY